MQTQYTEDTMPKQIAIAATLIAALTLAGCGAGGVHVAVTEPASLPSLRAADGTSNPVHGRFIVLYRSAVPATAATGTLLESLPALNAQVVHSDAPDAAARLAAAADVEAVLQDIYVEGHQMGIGATPAPTTDAYYRSPQNWAVVQAGGYGAGIGGGPSNGPWSTTRGAGVRIAVLDSGVDAAHPDISPNLALATSEVDITALQTPCDDGTAQDQHGHGTWAASLAAGAAGAGTGGVIGVAPQASLLSIKVLARVPASDGSCDNGQTAGLLSWVLKGIDDAVAAHANVISFSLGSLIDTQTGAGAGWKAAFDRATHAAANEGIVLIAAAGNDGLDLSSGRYLELPAQSRDVLAIVGATNPACMEAQTGACNAGPVTRASYSNHGIANAIAAPGGAAPNASENGVSGYIRGACSATACFNQGGQQYVQAIGTSASAPLTAGAAALLRAAHPAWTAARITTALRSTAQPSSALSEPLLNTAAALTAAP